MFHKKNKIFLKDWMALKPYEKQSSTDLYYLRLCNQVQEEILDFPFFAQQFSGKKIREYSCFLVSYFEDIISETNIWNAFLKKHQALYGKKLPFFDTQHYDENEINLADVQFLTWYFLNLQKEGAFVWPSNQIITVIAESVMEVFEQEYDYAPENEVLKSCYSLPENAHYYEARELMSLLFTSTYLFFPDTGRIYLDLLQEIKASKPEISAAYFKEGTDRFTLETYSKLLALRSNEWAALVLGEEHGLYEDLLTISERAVGWFYYKGQDKTNIDLEHIATGKKFKLTKKSYDDHDKLDTNNLVYLGMAKWKGEWWFSGISAIQRYDAELVEEQKNSEDAHMDLDFLADQQKLQEILEQQEKMFLDFNNGSLLAFLEKEEISGFANGFINYYNKSLGGDEPELNQEFDFGDDLKNVVAFFNPNSGVEYYFDIGSVFPLKGNPFYDKKAKDQDFREMLLSDTHSKEILQFCLQNFKEDLEFFQRKEQYNDQEFDFLLRFYKNENYHTKPKVTLSY